MIQKNIRKVSIMGVHKRDIVMYCAEILRKLGFRILVCDRTRQHELSACIQRPDKALDLVRYKGVDFAFSELVSLDEEYDYMFYVQNYMEGAQLDVTRTIYVCDGIWAHAQELIRELGSRKQAEENALLVFRDLYTRSVIQLVQEQCDIQCRKVTVGHDCMDEAAYQHLQFEPFAQLSALSSNMEAALKTMLCFASGLGEKEIKRGLKVAKRGRAY